MNLMKMHTDESHYVCEVCNEGFSMKRDLNNHLQIHTGEKPHVCEICIKGF